MTQDTQKTHGVVLVFIDEKGHAIAHAADFEPSAPGGFKLVEGQRHRARNALNLAVCSAYASPNLVRGMAPYDQQRIVERLCFLHKCRIHEIVIGND